jgi:mono/diheme cytochrome c family protein
MQINAGCAPRVLVGEEAGRESTPAAIKTEKPMRAVLFTFALCLMTPPVASQESGPVERGRNVAMQLCSGCHIVAPGQRRPSTVIAPTFNAIANRPGMNEVSLQNFLRVPHPIMPMLILSTDEMSDVASFVMSLKGR